MRPPDYSQQHTWCGDTITTFHYEPPCACGIEAVQALGSWGDIQTLQTACQNGHARARLIYADGTMKHVGGEPISAH